MIKQTSSFCNTFETSSALPPNTPTPRKLSYSPGGICGPPPPLYPILYMNVFSSNTPPPSLPLRETFFHISFSLSLAPSLCT